MQGDVPLALSRIRGQDHAIELIAAARATGRLSHAYLFRGPEGVGKETTALELAKALNCEAGGLDGCGECGSCRMADGLHHPDIHLIFPMPRTAKASERGDVLKKRATDGYRDEGFGRKTAILSVETVLREVVVKANQRPYVGPWKVFIIADADRMTTEAANTLLKTLEEPPEMTVIVLTTARPSSLPATVVSRCQNIQFARLDRETVREILVGDPRLGFDDESARSAAALAQGSAGRAARAGRDGLAAEIDRVAGMMGGKRPTSVKALVETAERLAYRLGRREQERILELMLLWYRDVLLVEARGRECADADVLYAGYRGDLELQAGGMDLAAVGRLIDRIEAARRAIERYSNPSIVFTSVLLDVAVARRKAEERGEARHAA